MWGVKNQTAAAVLVWLDLQQKLLLGIFVVLYSCYFCNHMLGFYITYLMDIMQNFFTKAFIEDSII